MKKIILNRKSSQPLYKQLIDVLLEEIISKKLRRNVKFYNERLLALKYNVSTITAKRALEQLVYMGILYRIPRKGTFIKKNIVSRNEIEYTGDEESLKNNSTVKMLLLKNKIIENEIIKKVSIKGDKLPSVRSLAKKYHATPLTIQKVLNSLKKENIIVSKFKKGFFLNTIDMYNFIPKNKIISLIIPSPFYFYDIIEQEVVNFFDTKDYMVLTEYFQSKRGYSEKILNFIGLFKMAGFIIKLTDDIMDIINENRILEKLKLINTPVVLLNEKNNKYKFDNVLIDSKYGTFLATEHLIKLNHKRIAFISFEKNEREKKEKYLGYCEALRRYNIKSRYKYEIFSWKSFILQLNDLILYLKNKKITGLVCYNDDIANNILLHFQFVGIKVPEEISLIGFDNVKHRSHSIQITTVDPNISLLGRKAAEFLYNRIQNPNMHKIQKFIIKPVLVKGRTARRI